VEKKNERFLYVGANYHYYGNLKRDNKTQGREKLAASIEDA
jgi:hypothetical protein